MLPHRWLVAILVAQKTLLEILKAKHKCNSITLWDQTSHSMEEMMMELNFNSNLKILKQQAIKSRPLLKKPHHYSPHSQLAVKI